MAFFPGFMGMYGRTSTVVKGALGAATTALPPAKTTKAIKAKAAAWAPIDQKLLGAVRAGNVRRRKLGMEGRCTIILEEAGFILFYNADDEVRRRGFAGKGSVERLLEFGVGFVDFGLVHNGLYFSTRAAFSRSRRRVRCRWLLTVATGMSSTPPISSGLMSSW